MLADRAGMTDNDHHHPHHPTCSTPRTRGTPDGHTQERQRLPELPPAVEFGRVDRPSDATAYLIDRFAERDAAAEVATAQARDGGR